MGLVQSVEDFKQKIKRRKKRKKKKKQIGLSPRKGDCTTAPILLLRRILTPDGNTNPYSGWQAYPTDFTVAGPTTDCMRQLLKIRLHMPMYPIGSVSLRNRDQGKGKQRQPALTPSPRAFPQVRKRYPGRKCNSMPCPRKLRG